MADDITDTVYFSNWCMVTESIMKWVFWYLSYIMSSYKHWNVDCIGENHHLIVLNKIGCIFTLMYGYWKYHEMGVLIFILHYFLVQTLKCGMCLRQPPLHIAFIGCILHIMRWLILDVLILVVFYTLVYWLLKVSWNKCFDINRVLYKSLSNVSSLPVKYIF